jgi:hypothetical protein
MPNYKYFCIGTLLKNYQNKGPIVILPEWLPRWYKIPFDECVFVPHDSKKSHAFTWRIFSDLMVLTYRPNNDFEHHLNILKTKLLLEGKTYGI